jgi:polysaccharide deacetylase family protein (PEP-CTERM system associated)
MVTATAPAAGAAPRRLALLSMDVEDWYHLEYFQRQHETEPSMLDGVERFAQLLAGERIPATFFVVGDVARSHPAAIRSLMDAGHEIASHGPDHQLVTRVPVDDFVRQLAAHKDALEQQFGIRVRGYRAPCFSMDGDKVRRLPEIGFTYDSSWIRFTSHPLYVHMDVSDWPDVCEGVRRRPGNDFVEFEVPTASLGSMRVPFSGGGYFRIFPWSLLRAMTTRYLEQARVFVFFIHPFECSARNLPSFPPGTSLSNRVRFQMGRDKALPRVGRLVRLLREHGWEFATFSDARARLLA